MSDNAHAYRWRMRFAITVFLVGVLLFPSSILYTTWRDRTTARNARVELCQGLNANRDVLRQVLSFARDRSLDRSDLDTEERQRIRNFYASAISRVDNLNCEPDMEEPE